MTKKTIQFTVNGENHTLDIDPTIPLLYVLRNQLEINGPKYGCGLGQCGSCMVLMENNATLSCLIPVGSVQGKKIITLAGLMNENGMLHPVQEAFVDEQAAQCGYCTNGMIISAVALLNNNPNPDDSEMLKAMQINLCRCGTQSRVIRAIQKAKGKMALKIIKMQEE